MDTTYKRVGRLEYIDAARAVSIIMIMYGHVTSIGNPVDLWMSSCKVSIFYVISGFLIAYTSGLQRRSPGQFLQNICKNLAWPYIVFSLITILVKCFYAWSSHKGSEFVIQTLKKMILASGSLKGINSMWFLPTLFFGEIILMILYHLPKICRWIYGVAGLFGIHFAVYLTERIQATGLSGSIAIAAVNFINVMGKSIYAAWFLGAGYITYLLMRRFHLLEDHYTGKAAAGIIMTLLNIYLSQLNKSVDFNNMKLGSKPYLFILGGIIGSLGIIFILDVLSQHMSLSKLSYWGRNSLIIMCTHTTLGIRAIAVSGWAKVANIPDHFCCEYILQTVMATAVMMLMVYALIEVINRYFPFLTKFPELSAARKEA